MGCMKTLRLLCFVLEAGACCVAQTDLELTIHLSYTHGVAHVRLHWFLFSWSHFNEVVHTLQLQKAGTEQLKQQSQRNSMRVNIRVLYFKLMCERGGRKREERREKGSRKKASTEWSGDQRTAFRSRFFYRKGFRD